MRREIISMIAGALLLIGCAGGSSSHISSDIPGVVAGMAMFTEALNGVTNPCYYMDPRQFEAYGAYSEVPADVDPLTRRTLVVRKGCSH